MQTALPTEELEGYKSKSQRARVATETWAVTNLFCPNCDNPRLNPSPANTPSIDYTCLKCDAPFQLKAQSRALTGRIVDAAYSSMIHAIKEDRTPNLFALHYDAARWEVSDLILIPQFAFPLSAIERRNPLAPTARRAGWVGCNILLSAIPLDARITIVSDGAPATPRSVRQQYARLRPIEKLGPEQRGWTLNVLNVVRALGKQQFGLDEIYAFEEQLSHLHPSNRHIRDKIRQQLQVLRDLGLLEFLGRGEYRLH